MQLLESYRTKDITIRLNCTRPSAHHSARKYTKMYQEMYHFYILKKPPLSEAGVKSRQTFAIFQCIMRSFSCKQIWSCLMPKSGILTLIGAEIQSRNSTFSTSVQSSTEKRTMKRTQWILASALSFNCDSATADAPSIRRGTNDSSRRRLDNIRKRTLETGETGTFLTACMDYGDNRSAEGKPHMIPSVELEGGLIYSLLNVEPSWASEIGEGLESGRTKIRIGEGATLSGGTIDLHGGAPEVVESDDDEDVRRELSSLTHPLTIGERTVVAVRIITSDGAYDQTEDYLREELFGKNGGDSFNFISQYKACRQVNLHRATQPCLFGLL